MIVSTILVFYLVMKLLVTILLEVSKLNKPTPAQWIQLVLDVLGAIGMALLAIFK